MRFYTVILLSLIMSGCAYTVVPSKIRGEEPHDSAANKTRSESAAQLAREPAANRDSHTNNANSVSINRASTDSANAYVDFIKKTTHAIPVLPWQSLFNNEFRRYLLCALVSPEAAIAKELANLDDMYARGTYKDNFEKSKAFQKLEQIKSDLIHKARGMCKPMKAPMFYADVIFPLTDKSFKPGSDTAYISLRSFEMNDSQGVRQYFNGAGFKMPDRLYLLSGVHNVWIENQGNKSALSMKVGEFEEKYRASSKYDGENRDYKAGKEVGGRVYFSLAKYFEGDFISPPKYVFWLYPEYFVIDEFRVRGELTGNKVWRRTDYNYYDLKRYSVYK